MGWWVYPLDPGIYCFSTEASQQKSPLGPETRDISSPTHPHLSLLLGGDGRGLWDFGTPMERIKLIVKAMEIGLESPFGGKKTYFKISRSWNTLKQKKPTHLKLFLKYVKLSWADPHSGSKPPPSLGGLEIRWSLRELSPELRWWMQSYHTVDGRNPANHLRCFFNPGILMVDSPNTGEFTGFLKHESTIFPMISKVTLLFSVCPGKSYSHEKKSAESLNLMVLFVMTRYDSLHLDESKKHTPLSHHSVTLRFRETCSPTRWCNMCDLFIPDRETGHDSPLKRVRWVR